MKFYRQLHLSLPLRVGLAGFVSGVVMALLPASFRDNTGLREFLITGDASWYLAAIAFVAQFILTLVAFGSGAPEGLFALSYLEKETTTSRRNFSAVTATPVNASCVSEGVINLVKTSHFDVLVLGASREGLLQQAIKGNIPTAIASRVESTVILVRGAIDK